MAKKNKQPTLVRTPSGSYVLKKDDILSECKLCKKDELRTLVYTILNALPVDLLTDYACEKLNLMSHDQWMDAGADAASMRSECEG
jgi:hypothetical protein